VQPDQRRHLAWENSREVQCILQQRHEMRPLTVPDHHKVLQNRFFAWCKAGECRARCCARSLALAPWPSHMDIGRVDSTRVSQLKLRGKSREPAQNPLIQITIEVCDHAKGGSIFQSGCQGNPSSCGGPCHGSVLEKCKAPANMQPCLQAGSISNSFPKIFKTMYTVRARVACQGLKSASL
jgi:hypothetical protein